MSINLRDLVLQKDERATKRVWMGIGISKRIPKLPIDMLVPIYYMSKASERAVLLIADDLDAMGNFYPIEEARKIGDEVENQLHSMIKLLSANNIEIMRWKDVVNDRYCGLYDLMCDPDFLGRNYEIEVETKRGKRIAKVNPLLRAKIALPSRIQKKVRDIPLSTKPLIKRWLGYVIGETAVTLWMAEKGYTTKVGHKGEKRYDVFSSQIYKILQEEGHVSRKPTFLYLVGGYDRIGRQVPHYDYCSEMITVGDRLDEIKITLTRGVPLHEFIHLPDRIREEIANNPSYPEWCCTLLRLVGYECDPSIYAEWKKLEELAELVYEKIVKPIQNAERDG